MEAWEGVKTESEKTDDTKTQLDLLQEKMAIQCAPVIFNLKPSNLLILESVDEEQLQLLMRRMKLSCQLFYRNGEKTIWFVYRKEWLQSLLGQPEIIRFFEEKKYRKIQEIPVEHVIGRVGKRFFFHKKGRTEYPHELGLLLGYPLCDVKGFIENQGKCYLCSGYWKVYANEQEARKTFDLYHAARKLAGELIQKRVNIWELSGDLLAVAA